MYVFSRRRSRLLLHYLLQWLPQRDYSKHCHKHRQLCLPRLRLHPIRLHTHVRMIK